MTPPGGFKCGDIVKRIREGRHQYGRVLQVQDSGALRVLWDGKVKWWIPKTMRVYLVRRGDGCKESDRSDSLP